MKVNFNTELEKAPSTTSAWFKPAEGDNRLRILSPSAINAKHYSPTGYKGVCIGKDDGCKGCAEGTKPSVKYLVRILDKKDNKVKLYNMPYKAFQQLAALQSSEDWGFSEVPMPYDINLHTKGAGNTDVVYTIMPTPKRDPLEAEVLTELDRETPPDIIIEKMKDKERKAVSGTGTTTATATTPAKVDYPDEGINLDDIPFN